MGLPSYSCEEFDLRQPWDEIWGMDTAICIRRGMGKAMIKELLVIEKDAGTWEEAIRYSAEALFRKGYVKDSFYQACVEREKKFPTGLPTKIPVAIPHTDAEHVNEPAVCLIRLKKPVEFYSMEDGDETVAAEFVFNMALEKGEKQLEMIQAIITTAQNSTFLSKAKGMTPDEIYQTLYEEWSLAGIIS